MIWCKSVSSYAGEGNWVKTGELVTDESQVSVEGESINVEFCHNLKHKKTRPRWPEADDQIYIYIYKKKHSLKT